MFSASYRVDTGYGLSKCQICNLFRPFERLNAKNSNIEGTGIGLHLCKKLVEAMNGNIGVSSIEGTDSCFWIEIPDGNVKISAKAEAIKHIDVEV